MEPLPVTYPDANSLPDIDDAIELLEDDNIVPLLHLLPPIPNHGPRFLAGILLKAFELVKPSDHDIEDQITDPYVLMFKHYSWYIIEFSYLAKKYGKSIAIQVFFHLDHIGAISEHHIIDWYSKWFFQDPMYAEEEESSMELLRRRQTHVLKFWHIIKSTKAWDDAKCGEFYGTDEHPELAALYRHGVWLESNKYIILSNTSELRSLYEVFCNYTDEMFGNNEHDADYIPIGYYDIYNNAEHLPQCLHSLLSAYGKPATRSTA